MALSLGTLAACAQDPTGHPSGSTGSTTASGATCQLDSDFLSRGAAIDQIQSLDEPRFVSARDSVPAYLDSDTRVVGLVVGERAFAVPHNVLWFHEIVNLTADARNLAVTYCPLTGSSLVFDRVAVGGAPLGVSGLLFKSNLVMFERKEDSSRWPQMIGEARCGRSTGSELGRWPAVEMEWSAWLRLHPGTEVLAQDQGFPWDYEASSYPYGDYEHYSVTSFLGPMPPLDTRRPAKERVLGIPPTFAEDGQQPVEPAIAFPFDALTALAGAYQVVRFDHRGRRAILLWSDDARGGMVFRPLSLSTNSPATLRVTEAGLVDEETSSLWSVHGHAVSGPRSGERLLPVEKAHVAFWGAWAAFHPETLLWGGDRRRDRSLRSGPDGRSYIPPGTIGCTLDVPACMSQRKAGRREVGIPPMDSLVAPETRVGSLFGLDAASTRRFPLPGSQEGCIAGRRASTRRWEVFFLRKSRSARGDPGSPPSSRASGSSGCGGSRLADTRRWASVTGERCRLDPLKGGAARRSPGPRDRERAEG